MLCKCGATLIETDSGNGTCVRICTSCDYMEEIVTELPDGISEDLVRENMP